MTTIIANTNKHYPCVFCGSEGNIVREAPSLEATRVKCRSCNATYFASDSVAAKEAGAIPDAPPVLDDQESQQDVVYEDSSRYLDAVRETAAAPGEKISNQKKLPGTPSYMLIAKDRLDFELCTQKDFKKIILKWTAADRKFDVYQLTPKKVSAKVDIS